VHHLVEAVAAQLGIEVVETREIEVGDRGSHSLQILAYSAGEA
jgi:hypothetical protein